MSTSLAPPFRAIPGPRSRQRGAAGIEFALAFPLIFVLFYAIVSYGLVMTLQQSLHESAKEGARAAVAVEPKAFPNGIDDPEYQARVTERARAAVGRTLSWLPDAWRTAVIGSTSGEKVGVRLDGTTITVTLTYPYAETPLLPTLTLPLFGKIPKVPDHLVVQAVAEL